MNGGRRLRVAILTGGRSGEHEVSLQSANSVVSALDPEKYEAIVIGIGKDGSWRGLPAGDFVLHPGDPKRIALRDGPPVLPPRGADEWELETGALSGPVDVVFPVLHGTFGEDGTVQGLLEMADVAYVGSGVLGSAVAMDKDVAKRLLRAEGLAVADWVTLRDPTDVYAPVIADSLGLPLFVKPANLGSSVGISKAKDMDELTEAIALAFTFDTKVIVERAIDGREIEVAVLDGDPPTASVPGEIVPRHEFYSYAAKYLDDDGADLIVSTELTAPVADAVREQAVRAFCALECEGLARVDFFVERGTDRVLVNEINTMPGFTRISMYPKLWKASGVSYAELLDRLIDLAIRRHEKRARLSRTFLPR